MDIREIRANVHQLVDEIENPQVLDHFYEALQSFRTKRSGVDFWDEFTDEQKKDLELALAETENEENWVSHEQVKQEAQQWLRE